jgi:hypothetical protein
VDRVLRCCWAAPGSTVLKHPVLQPDGSVLVRPGQVALHRTSEKLAVWVGAPLLLWVATRQRELTGTERSALLLFAVTTVAIDGWLLARYEAA